MNDASNTLAKDDFLRRYPAFLVDTRSGIGRFRSLDREDVLKTILPYSNEITVGSGTVILEQGKPNYDLYILLKGRLEVIVDGKPVLQLKRSGDLAGEISFVSGAGCSATVFAASESNLLSIRFQDINHAKDVKDLLLSVLANKVIWTTQLKNISDGESEAEVAKTKTELAEEKSLRQELEKAYETIQVQNRTLKDLNSKLSDHAKELERARGSEDSFLRYISHELRTPLHHILGFSSILMSKAEDHGCKEQVEMIEMSGKRLLSYINRLLDLSYLSADDVEFTLEKIHLKSFILDISSLLEEVVQDKDMKFEFSFCEDDVYVAGDRMKVLDVLKELVDNAAKYSNGNEIITIETLHDGESVVCSVRDGGIGIPQEELETIFDAFTQSSKTDIGSGGQGIGLSISQKIVNMHEGKIWARNNPEGGTTVSFSLPIYKP